MRRLPGYLNAVAKSMQSRVAGFSIAFVLGILAKEAGIKELIVFLAQLLR
jgi:hypothetical protein